MTCFEGVRAQPRTLRVAHDLVNARSRQASGITAKRAVRQFEARMMSENTIWRMPGAAKRAVRQFEARMMSENTIWRMPGAAKRAVRQFEARMMSENTIWRMPGAAKRAV